MSAEYDGASEMSDTEEVDYDGEVDDTTEDVDSEGSTDSLIDDVTAEAQEYVNGEEEDEEVSEEEPDDKAAKEEEKKFSRADKRIQSIIAERKRDTETFQNQLKQQEAHFQAQLQQQAYIQHQLQQQMQQQREEAIGRQKELELFQRQRQIQEEENLSPVEQLERKMERRAMEIADEKYRVYQQQADEREQRLIQMQQEQERNGRINAYDEETTSSARSLMTGWDEKTTELLGPQLKTHILNHSAVHNMDPKDGAKDFDIFARRYAMARQKVLSKKNGQALAKGKKVPAASPTSRRPVKGKAVMTQAQAQKAGYTDALEALAAQRAN